ncbi:MAG: hypothetical protein ACM3MH_06275 [Actinomycetota bacterium]
MQSLGLLIGVLAVMVANLPALSRQWHQDRPGVIKTLWLAAAYLVYCLIGVGLLLWLASGIKTRDNEAWKPLELTGVVLGFILYGSLTLMRVVPRYREPPRWLMRFGVADVIVLALMFGSIAAFLWL